MAVGLDEADKIALGLSFGIPLVVFLVFGGVIFALVHKPRPESMMGPDGVIRLQGHLVPASTLLAISDTTFGRLEVTVNELVWHPLVGPVWRVPIPALFIHPPRAFSLGATAVVFEIPGAGAWRLEVSDRGINRLVRNDFKTRREAQRADEVRDVLLSRGARLLAA